MNSSLCQPLASLLKAVAPFINIKVSININIISIIINNKNIKKYLIWIFSFSFTFYFGKTKFPTKLLWFPDCGEPGVRKFHANWFLTSNLFQSLRKMMGPPISTPPLPHSTSHKMQIFRNMWWKGKNGVKCLSVPQNCLISQPFLQKSLQKSLLTHTTMTKVMTLMSLSEWVSVQTFLKE